LPDSHVEFTPNDVDKELDSREFHQLAKDTARNFEAIRIYEDKCGSHFLSSVPQGRHDVMQNLETVLAGRVDHYFGRKVAELFDFAPQFTEIRFVTLDEKEHDFASFQEARAILVLKQSLEGHKRRTKLPLQMPPAPCVSVDIHYTTMRVA